jgi:hypothetical protein
MITAEKAMAIANAEAERLEWGGVPDSKYQAVLVTLGTRQVWSVSRKDPLWIGKSVRFQIDAVTADIIESRRMGTR